MAGAIDFMMINRGLKKTYLLISFSGFKFFNFNSYNKFQKYGSYRSGSILQNVLFCFEMKLFRSIKSVYCRFSTVCKKNRLLLQQKFIPPFFFQLSIMFLTLSSAWQTGGKGGGGWEGAGLKGEFQTFFFPNPPFLNIILNERSISERGRE